MLAQIEISLGFWITTYLSVIALALAVGLWIRRGFRWHDPGLKVTLVMMTIGAYCGLLIDTLAVLISLGGAVLAADRAAEVLPLAAPILGALGGLISSRVPDPRSTR